MILLTIAVTALSTEPRFQRKVTKCELLEYLDATENEYAAKTHEHFGDMDCNSGSVIDYQDDDFVEYEFTMKRWKMEPT
ncbi:hypothetical protein DPMN_118812 [Dreissena polymorpha]|uniref:Uncharacterized protein n=1 Tax=Dreissena polymorpha TaxID=45954 RepID=A0A9D4JNU9_DREPO|nr:hypothetical protein DPMN_118812 [Dreissena polymorpha]